mmetsp:Transcript_13666/g.27604  ORF Transcript_13666/g.27604 Transcript_13666/m.27604 type:complete len:189 (-) Transcript_13666:531-1097(-)
MAVLQNHPASTAVVKRHPAWCAAQTVEMQRPSPSDSHAQIPPGFCCTETNVSSLLLANLSGQRPTPGHSHSQLPPGLCHAGTKVLSCCWGLLADPFGQRLAPGHVDAWIPPHDFHARAKCAMRCWGQPVSLRNGQCCLRHEHAHVLLLLLLPAGSSPSPRPKVHNPSLQPVPWPSTDIRRRCLLQRPL